MSEECPHCGRDVNEQTWFERELEDRKDCLLLGIDPEETEVFNKVGGDDRLIAKLSLSEAKTVRRRLEKQIESMEER